MKQSQVTLDIVHAPQKDCSLTPIVLSDETMQARKEGILRRMRESGLDSIVLYADLEHGGNFEYLVGLVPRFEEALLVLHAGGEAFLVLGNENLNKAQYARLSVTAIHAPHFSLPNQPMDTTKGIGEILAQAKITEGSRVGLVGWKRFTSKTEDNTRLFDMPHYIVRALGHLVGDGMLTNATHLFIGKDGARAVCNVDEIAHYEFGASLAGDCVLDALNAVQVGVSEMELGDKLNRYGQRNSVVTIAATGARFEKAYLYPRNKQAQVGDRMALTVGYKGGLSSRVGYVVSSAEELPPAVSDYLEVVVKPYYNAICTWLETLKCGMTGKDVYDLVERVLPKSRYNWTLCPGHLVADEEWLASPIYEGSEEMLQSGMLLQTDIIPGVPGYGGVSVESTVCLADTALRKQIARENPALWERIQARRRYITEELHINLSEDVQPMCSTVGYMRPYLLDHTRAMKRG